VFAVSALDEHLSDAAALLEDGADARLVLDQVALPLGHRPRPPELLEYLRILGVSLRLTPSIRPP